MESKRSITVRWLHGGVGGGSYQLARCHFSRQTWQPAINAYRCEKCMTICVDVAGVEQAAIDLTVEPRRVTIRGNRDVPDPGEAEGRTMQLLAMEIDYGPFERIVRLPAEVDVERASAEQRNGFLWIHLPLKS